MKTEEKQDKLGLAHWMREVLAECERARRDFSADPVHDLRVALRRCRSLAAVVQNVDPHPAWKRMRKAGKAVFSALGELRDVHVMAEWVERLFPAGDATLASVMEFVKARESTLKQGAADALERFDQAEWESWAAFLPPRADKVAASCIILEHLALEHWNHAHELHRRALRDRSRTGYHNLRIGIKKLRYMVENFLPDLHQDFGKDLKRLQDLLGEVHDLDVLWATAAQLNKFSSEEARETWRRTIEQEREMRIAEYRSKMLGRKSLWRAWRARLPQGEAVERGSVERLKAWASFLDPEFVKSLRVSRLSLQLYDGLVGKGAFKTRVAVPGRTLLEVAAIMRDVGRAKRERKHQKSSYKLIRRLDPPFGWQKRDLEMAALIARYHRGALPSARNREFFGLSEAQKRQTIMLAGILRLIDAVELQLEGKVRSLEVEQGDEVIHVWAKGSVESTNSEKIAAARHLLEVAYHRPIMVGVRAQAA